MITDHYNRNIDYIRISITDRCNLRCRYCMPEDISFVGHDKILRYEEITRIVQILAQRGITKVKITGGEPLVRHECTDLIREIKEDACEMVLAGIQDAYKSGIPLKLNCVPIEGENTDELSEFFSWAKRKQIAVRFIEMMPIGYGKTYKSVPSDEILRQFFEAYPDAYRLEKSLGNGPAVYYSAPGFAGEIGVIGAIHEKFCNTCNRIRLTSEGFLKLCLYSGEGLDLRAMLRGGCSDEEIAEAVTKVIERKPKEHHFTEDGLHLPGIGPADADTRKMSQIGG